MFPPELSRTPGRPACHAGNDPYYTMTDISPGNPDGMTTPERTPVFFNWLSFPEIAVTPG